MAAATSPPKLAEATAATSPQILAGRTLRMMRETHGVSLRSFADIVGISASHLSRVESGRRRATTDMTERIVTALAKLPQAEDVA